MGRIDDLDGNTAALKKYQREQDDLARMTLEDQIEVISMEQIWEALGDLSGSHRTLLVDAVRAQDSLEVGSVVMDVIEEFLRE